MGSRAYSIPDTITCEDGNYYSKKNTTGCDTHKTMGDFSIFPTILLIIPYILVVTVLIYDSIKVGLLSTFGIFIIIFPICNSVYDYNGDLKYIEYDPKMIKGLNIFCLSIICLLGFITLINIKKKWSVFIHDNTLVVLLFIYTTIGILETLICTCWLAVNRDHFISLFDPIKDDESFNKFQIGVFLISIALGVEIKILMIFHNVLINNKDQGCEIPLDNEVDHIDEELSLCYKLYISSLKWSVTDVYQFIREHNLLLRI